MSTADLKAPSYLGDGVYARVNSHSQLVLTTGHHQEQVADNVVYIEPEVWVQLLRFMEVTKE